MLNIENSPINKHKLSDPMYRVAAKIFELC